MPAKKSATSIIQAPWQGLFLNMPSQSKDPHAFDDCCNVRIEEGRLRSDLMGETVFCATPTGSASAFADTGFNVNLIYPFVMSTGNTQLVVGTPTDLYYVAKPGTFNSNPSGSEITFITPTYSVGTVTATSGANSTVTGTGTFWATPIGGRAFGVSASAVTPLSPNPSEITLDSIPAGVFVDQLVYDNTNGAAIQVGTTIKSINGTTITLSTPVIGNVSIGDQIALGNGAPQLRNNVRPGDYIWFGTAGQNNPFATPTVGSLGWTKITAVASDGSLTIATNSSWSGTTSTVYTIRQCFTPWDTAPASPFAPFEWFWDAETFPQAGPPFNSDVMIAVNGYDPVFAWNGVSNSGTYRPEVPFIASHVRRFRNLMIYGGLLGENGQILPTSIANSDNGVPTTMAGGVAGQYVVSDAPGVINHLGILGSTLMIYLGGTITGSVYSASFVGFPTNFAFSQVIAGRGPVAARLVAEFPDRHQFLTMDGMYRYNGLFIQVMNDHIWRDIMNPNGSSLQMLGSTGGTQAVATFDYSRATFAFVGLHPGHGDLQWAVPLTQDGSTTAPRYAYVEHYMEQPNSYLFKPYTRRFFPYQCSGLYLDTANFTWDQFTGEWTGFDVPWNTQTILTPYIVQLAAPWTNYQSSVTRLYSANTDAAGNVSQQFVLFPLRPVSDGVESRGLIKRIYPFVEMTDSASGTGSLQVELFCQESPSNTKEQGFTGTVASPAITPATFNYLTLGPRFVSFYNRGFWAQVAFFNSSGAINGTAMWILDGYDWQVISGGRRGFNE